MIQESHVGVGILGKEGAHAAMSSDFVIKRFHHLRRLICVHGRYNFFRTTQVVLFSFYKNLAFPLPLFWFCFWSMANGTTSFDSLLMVGGTRRGVAPEMVTCAPDSFCSLLVCPSQTCFNTFFTSLPPFFAGLFDRDVHEDILMQSPGAFAAFKAQSPFTVRSIIYTLTTATYQSAVFYFLAHGMFETTNVIGVDGSAEDMSVMGNMILTSVFMTTNLSMLLALSSINYVNILATAIGFALYLGVFTFEAASYQVDLAPDGYGMGGPCTVRMAKRRCRSWPNFIVLIVCLSLCLFHFSRAYFWHCLRVAVLHPLRHSLSPAECIRRVLDEVVFAALLSDAPTHARLHRARARGGGSASDTGEDRPGREGETRRHFGHREQQVRPKKTARDASAGRRQQQRGEWRTRTRGVQDTTHGDDRIRGGDD
jgi:magnesium-transporting ATPase (P-type)